MAQKNTYDIRRFLLTNVAPKLPPSGAFLGVDWGRKKSGVAISDRERLISTPLGVVQTVSLEKHLHALWKEYAPVLLVIGWPLDMYDVENTLCTPLYGWMCECQERTGWPMALVEEGLTTHAAKWQSYEVSGRTRPSMDAHSAAIILGDSLGHYGRIMRNAQPVF